MNVTPRSSGRPPMIQNRVGILGVLLLLLLTGCKSKTQSENESSSSSSGDKLELVFSYGSEKEKWIGEVTEAFNRADHRASTASGGPRKPASVRCHDADEAFAVKIPEKYWR